MEIKAKRDDASGSGISLAFPGRTADKAAAVPESRKTSPCQKALGVSSGETSSAVLRSHGRLRYRVAVKKTSVAKVGSGFGSAARVRDLWYESRVPHTGFAPPLQRCR